MVDGCFVGTRWLPAKTRSQGQVGWRSCADHPCGSDHQFVDSGRDRDGSRNGCSGRAGSSFDRSFGFGSQSECWLRCSRFRHCFLRPVPGLCFVFPYSAGTVTNTGLLVAGRLLLRALASSTTAAVLVLSTQWQAVLKALRRFGVPTVAVMLIGMSYRYIVLFVQTAIELTNARKSRTVGRMRLAERRRLALSSVGVLLERAFSLGNEVHLAMQARGYRGEVLLLDDYSMSPRDWVALARACLL